MTTNANINKEEAINTINASCASLEAIKATIKQLEAQKATLEEQILTLKHEVCNEATLKTNLYAITEKATNRYEISEEGVAAVKAGEGENSGCFVEQPVMRVIMKLGKYDKYITCNEGKTSVTLKKIVEG